MTQKDTILQFLSKRKFSLRPIEIARLLKIKPPSVRRALFNLRQEKLVSSPRDNRRVNILEIGEIVIEKKKIDETVKKLEEEEEEEPEIFRREIVKVLVYCPDEPHRAGFGHKLFALTYGNDPDNNHEDDLIAALDINEETEQGAFDLDFNFTEDRGKESITKFKSCLQASTYGYDDELETKDPPFIFPDIEVGEE